MSAAEDPIARIRRFNRAYTASIGVLDAGLHDSPFTLAQARLLFEIATAGRCTAALLCERLTMDPGQVSRLIASLARAGMIRRERSAADRRAWDLSLTPAGRKAFGALDRAARRQVSALWRTLSPDGRHRLLGAMDTIEMLATAPGPSAPAAPPIELRGHRIGDIGWIVHRQSILYGREYGWDIGYEALIAQIAGRFLEKFDPAHEACWVAQRGEQVLGSVFLVRRSAAMGQLRLLYVEPDARGQGVGDRLVQACIDRARDIGYRRLMLWTNDVLVAARRIYERKGFVKVSEDRHHSFGHDLVGQNWVLRLNG